MPGRLKKRTVRKMRRNALFLAALLALLLVIFLAFEFAPHDDTPRLRVPAAAAD